ncbi:SDR family NAD(P)-dependent oxidoreductase [Roseibium salinum]|uniref:SDR family NAD(P)-dependent oxidoreductase n=1 Tax=Roseibium salinum TaxID=1604349 RepID=A0ABT3QWB7_9HYPH|nr:SDR family NAD(P)-dependent oxidoreductase [Roseibium sp. DSM 29163]MCX2721148.1 SDR family NAD(P)-dependent oxidoreductase [Roseibium sp. DSM 29163]
MTHPAIQSGNVAVVTGGASGIGLAISRRLGREGLKVCIADLPGQDLDAAVEAVRAAGAPEALAMPTDVADPEALKALERRVTSEVGPVSVLVNNAGIQPGSSIFDAENNWQRIISVNMWGIIRGSQIFAPGMIATGRPGLIINTGSKQGITTPPGDPAYNVSKSAVKTFTEALQHELRNTEGCMTEARLLIPGFVFTPLTANGRTEKPAGAWTPDQTADFLFDALGRDDFYILCPDNEVDRATDEKRIAWAAGDITQNRPPLSRWHPDYGAAFKAFLEQEAD